MTNFPFAIALATPRNLKFLDHLQSSHKYALGFLPGAALDDYLRNHQVLITFENEIPAGYLLWRHSFHPIGPILGHGLQVVQLCVEPDARRILHATTLLEPLKRMCLHHHWPWIRCWCADDLEANSFWQALHFQHDFERQTTTGNRPGRRHIHWTLSSPNSSRRVRLTGPSYYPQS